MSRQALRVGEHGEIKVRRSSSGKWVARVRFRSPRNGQLEDITAQADTKAAARRRLESKLATRAHVLDADMTVEQASDAYLAAIRFEARLEPTSIHHYSTLVKNHIKPQIGQLKLAQLDRRRAVQFIMDVHSRRPGTGPRVRSLLRLVLSHAVAEGWITSNVLVETVRLPKKKWVNPIVFDAQAISELIIRADAWKGSTPIGLYIRIAVTSGGRCGEILGLRAGDYVPADEQYPASVHFRGSVIQPKETGVHRRDSLKTERSRRGVEIPPVVALAIEERIVQIKAKLGHVDGNTLLFATRTGRPITPSAMRRTWGRVRGATSDEAFHVLGTHSFRKTFATAAAGLYGAENAARLLGHTSTHQLNSAYLRVSETLGLAPVMAGKLDSLNSPPALEA